jgi:hypothetical protein
LDFAAFGWAAHRPGESPGTAAEVTGALSDQTVSYSRIDSGDGEFAAGPLAGFPVIGVGVGMSDDNSQDDFHFHDYDPDESERNDGHHEE